MSRQKRLVLASASPRRRELLESIGYTPDVVRAPDVDESVRRGELPDAYCRRVARDKAEAISLSPDDVLVCGDTTVALGRRILGKPVDAAEAKAFLQALSGRRHRVITAVVVRTYERTWLRDAKAIVRMKRLSSAEIERYVASGEWKGKAGGYAVQGKAAAFIPWIRGSYTAIVGLPLPETSGLLTAAGLVPGAGPS